MVDETLPISVSNTHDTLRIDEDVIIALVQHVCREEDASIDDLGVVLGDHATVLDLNKTYLSHDYITDVLSFPLNDTDGTAVDGEIYVDLDTARERHAEFDVTFEAEACRYIVHGLLHLLGYRDATPAEKSTMKMKEDQYLSTLSNRNEIATLSEPILQKKLQIIRCTAKTGHWKIPFQINQDSPLSFLLTFSYCVFTLSSKCFFNTSCLWRIAYGYPDHSASFQCQ